MTKNEEIILLADFLDFEVYPLAAFDSAQFEGQNQQKTLIVLGEESQTEEQKQFLEKIMSAVQFNLQEDTLIYALSQDRPISFSVICQNNDIEKVIFFNTPLEKMGLYLQLPKYRPIHWNDFQLLNADSLAQISKEKRLKGGLWTALKAMFLTN